jgi:hypothetical protein
MYPFITTPKGITQPLPSATRFKNHLAARACSRFGPGLRGPAVALNSKPHRRDETKMEHKKSGDVTSEYTNPSRGKYAH